MADRNNGAVDGNKAARGPGALLVHRARQELLARSAFSLDQHRAAQRSNLRHEPENVQHRLAARNQPARGDVAGGLLLPQEPVLDLEALMLQGSSHREAQDVKVDRLQQVVFRAELDGLHRRAHASVARHDENSHIGIDLAGLAQDVQPVLSGKHEVENHDVKAGFVDPRNRLRPQAMHSTS